MKQSYLRPTQPSYCQCDDPRRRGGITRLEHSKVLYSSRTCFRVSDSGYVAGLHWNGFPLITVAATCFLINVQFKVHCFRGVRYLRRLKLCSAGLENKIGTTSEHSPVRLSRHFTMSDPQVVATQEILFLAFEQTRQVNYFNRGSISLVLNTHINSEMPRYSCCSYTFRIRHNKHFSRRG